MSRTEPTSAEIKWLTGLIESHITPTVHHLGSDRTTVARYDKREAMYGGDGVVYLLQMFQEGELVNNRIGAFMVLPEAGTSAGFHTHGTRNEQELYLVLHGQGIYKEKDDWESAPRTYPVSAGSCTTVKGSAFHAVENCSDEPLIIFVITTNEPESLSKLPR